MQGGMEFFMDSYLPEIPKERNFPYLKLFYLLPKLKELNLSIPDFSSWKKSRVRKDLENRIHVLLDFILEKELFSSWSDNANSLVINELDSLRDFNCLTSKMYEFLEKITEVRHFNKLNRVLDVLFSSDPSHESSEFFLEASSLIYAIKQEYSYEKWEREKYVQMLEHIDALLLSPSFNQNVFYGKEDLVDLLFILLDYMYPKRGYDLDEKRKDYLSALKWYNSVKDMGLGTNNLAEETVKPSDIKWMVDRAKDRDTAEHLDVLPLHYVLDLLSVVDTFVLRCEDSKVILEESQKEALDFLKRLLKQYVSSETVEKE